MPYNISSDPEAHCVFAIFEGTVDIVGIQRVAVEFVKASSRHDCLALLIDMREAKLTMSILEIYKIPQIMVIAGVDPRCKRAVVASQITEDYRFFETVSVNSGQILKIFTDFDSAKRWLMIPAESMQRVVN